VGTLSGDVRDTERFLSVVERTYVRSYLGNRFVVSLHDAKLKEMERSLTYSLLRDCGKGKEIIWGVPRAVAEAVATETAAARKQTRFFSDRKTSLEVSSPAERPSNLAYDWNL